MERAHRPSRPVWIWGLLVIWLVGTVVAFWWFQGRNLRAFYAQPSEQYALFQNAGLTEPLRALLNRQDKQGQGTYSAYVVHFWDPECPCTRFNTQHVEQLIQLYGHRGVKFLVVPRRRADRDEYGWEQLGDTWDTDVTLVDPATLALSGAIPASPATVVLDRNKTLAYFGPYSLGAVCTASDEGFVEQVLEGLLQGQSPEFRTISGFGCFCSWQAA